MTVSHGHRVAVLALVAALVAVPAASVAATTQQTTQTGIASCTTIDQSGEYVLTSDVGANASGDACITISAGDVTLDGNGHSVDGGGGATTGILVERGRQNVVISDVTATGWTNGIELVDAYGARVEGATLSGNQFGVLFSQTADATVADSTLTGNDVGVGAEDSTIALENVEATENAIGVEGYLASIEVSRSALSNNDNLGVRIDSGDLIVDRSAIQNNGGDGVRAVNADNAKIQYSIISGNGGNGVSGQVDARENWWGAKSGPSGNVEDPVTGRLADGSGDSVSEGTESGVSSVRFDPYYVTDPRDGDGQLVGEQSTTSEPTTDQPTTTTTNAPATDDEDGGAGDGGAGDGDGQSGNAGDNGTGGAGDATTVAPTTQSATDGQSTTTGGVGATTSATTGDTATTAVTDGEAQTTGSEATTTSGPAAGPGAPVNGSNETTVGENGTRTAQVIGGEGTETSGESGPGFGVVAALVALAATALLARRH